MISEIEQRRTQAAVSQKDLCARAGVDATTYSQLKRGRRGAMVKTMDKLSRALDQIIKEKDRG
ncbi:helix-turn-helix transcriptional regulator [Tianweitania sp. BSSL-BM11]|uniref:Helix-turn-helix transcriptional regulator n=1 Tax=Tianweitania aestuarii TaxID=2814886 RepID=A0ABS5RUU9_9HYPH|nr:helix-turn-helix transcriptional regulator [Tianweitania aestuarii]